MHKILDENLRSFFSNNKKEKVIFIGAGFSKNLGLPSWEEFAYLHLDFLRENYESMNFEIAELLKKDDFRTIMSMTKEIIFNNKKLKTIMLKEYNSIFKIKGSNKEKKVKDYNSIFRKVYDLNLINITTNYDDILDILANDKKQELTNVADTSNIGIEFKQKIFHSEKDFDKIMEEKNINFGDVYHIHGSVNDIDNMIISNEDYIYRYWNKENVYKKFLKFIFEEYDIIFLGYGLKELEILNYLFEKKKGTVNKTKNERLFILDCFNYEFPKVKLLEQYYLDNYSIKLCPYSKSEKGFNALIDVIDKISKIKSEEDNKNKKRIIGLNLLQKENLNSAEINKLLQNIKEYPDLQSAFFNKIHGRIGYLEYIDYNRYFNLENLNILSLMKYLNSIYKKEDISSKYINSIYKLAYKKLNQYWLQSDFIMFLFKYSCKLEDFNLKNILENDNEEKFKLILLKYFLLEDNYEIAIGFLEKNYIPLLNLISKIALKDDDIRYYLKNSEIILKKIINYNNMEFINKFIKNYEAIYLKTKYENNKIELNVINGILNIKSKNNSFAETQIINDSLEKIYMSVENSDIKDKDEIKRAIIALLNENSHFSVFDEFNKRNFSNNKKEDFLQKILMLSEEKDKIIEMLFVSKCYYLKKMALYFIVKNNMIDFIFYKINNKDFDFKYIIQNSEFAGELKEIFNLINNNNSKITTEGEMFLLQSIEEGKFIIFEEAKDNIKKWKYERLKELQNLNSLKLEFDKLKLTIKNDYSLSPLIVFEGGVVKTISKINEKEASNYNVYAWVEWMNNYKKEPHKEFLIEYDIKKDVKIFINNLKNNLYSYMNDFKYLINIDDYQWIYYILFDINEEIKVEKNIFIKYYKSIIKFIESYLEKLNNIYEEPDSYCISKKILTSKVCELLTNILRKKEFKVDEFIIIYKNMIKDLEKLISDKDDFNKIVVGSNTNYTSFLNSIHKDILELEFIFILKLNYSEENKVYIKSLILNRLKQAEKEFYVFFGSYLWRFKSLDRTLTEELICNMNRENKKMFLSGFNYCHIINEELYELVKPLFKYIEETKYNKEDISNIITYYTLGYLLEYKSADIKLLTIKEIINKNVIYNIFSLKNNYIKLVENYDENKFVIKMKEIWRGILALKWNCKDQEIIQSTIQAVENFDFIDDEISKNIININNFIEVDIGFNIKLCEYLIRIVSLENIDIVIKCINKYKSDYYDAEIIELCEKIKNISFEKFNDFKENWLLNNTKESKLKDYLLNIKKD